MFFIIIFCVWAFFIEPNMLVINKFVIKDPELKGIKIVFVSDFHIKKNQHKRLQKIINIINIQNPDLVLSTGDFVNGDNENDTMSIENIAKQLKNIKSRNGIYTVLGNHDWWYGGDSIIKELSKNKINILANSNVKLKINNKIIYIAGIEDDTTRNPNIFVALQNTKQPLILLTHSPDMFLNVPQYVNLTLAGHLHGGQVRVPFCGALITPSMYGNKYSAGFIQDNNKKMIVTKGIGTSIIPIRFNCLPEIVVIEFSK